jgi:hypothetical protein
LTHSFLFCLITNRFASSCAHWPRAMYLCAKRGNEIANFEKTARAATSK